MREIYLLIPVDYAAGGLQRSALALRDCLDSAGYSVTIYCFKILPDGLASRHPFVRPIADEHPRKLLFWLQTLRTLRRHIREGRPNAVIAFGTVPAILLPMATAFMRDPLRIGSERAYLPAEQLTRSLERLRRATFPRLDFIVCQTAGIRNWYLAHLPVKKRQLIVIPNVVAAAPARKAKDARPSATSSNILCVGRLDRQKGFSIALEIFARVLEKQPGALLTIAGEGPLKEQLELKAKTLGVAARVNFTGRLADLAHYWSSADVFLFTSLYEGFPNALAEAMANGVPPVAFDCPTGPSELITDGADGYLVPLGDVDAASARCIELLADPEKRRRFGEQARQVADRYSAKRVGRLWIDLVGGARSR